MKYVTGGYVSEVEAGQRLAQVIDDPQCTKSGVYWSWNGNAQQVGLQSRTLNKETGKWEWQLQVSPLFCGMGMHFGRTRALLLIPFCFGVSFQGAGGSGGDIFENSFSGMISDSRRAAMQYDLSMQLVNDFL